LEIGIHAEKLLSFSDVEVENVTSRGDSGMALAAQWIARSIILVSFDIPRDWLRSRFIT
jgi:hypothetical protein